MSDRSKATISEQNSSEEDNFTFRWEMVNYVEHCEKDTIDVAQNKYL